MINLAGGGVKARYCAENELKKAGIEVVNDLDCLNNEVSISIAGQYGSFKFVRAWYYWMVAGKVPLKVAQELYKSELGKKDVRVVGHCGCPPPEGWATWLDDDGLLLISLEEDEKIKNTFNELSWPLPGGYRAVLKEDFPKVGRQYITSYHIDSQEGLNLFIDTLKHHQLV